MSKKLAGIFNDLDRTIEVSQLDRGEGYSSSYPPGSHDLPYDNVPDNSDPREYWKTNRIQVTIPNGPSINFWDDDYDGYKIKWSYGDQAPAADAVNVMRGGEEGGDGTKVAIHVSQEPHGYVLTAVALTEDHNRKEVATQLQAFTNARGITPNGRPGDQEIRKYYDANDPAFTAMVDAAEACGFRSLGMVFGGGGSLGVGAETMSGVLTDLKGSVGYAMNSSAVTIGAEEGVVAFVGLYLSTESVEEVGGWEFFWELGLDVGVGVAFRAFTTFSGSTGLLVCLTTGEEVELSIGIGHTTATAMT